MGLDLGQVAPQIELMVRHLRKRQDDWRRRLDVALDVLQGVGDDVAGLEWRITDATVNKRTTWLAAGLTGPLSAHLTLPPTPPNIVVVGADGSDIQTDRHYAAHCFLINVSGVTLRYGDSPSAYINNAARLYFDDDDTTIPSPTHGEPPVLIEGQLFAVTRAVEEVRWLQQTAAASPLDVPAVGLLDGSLVMWGLSDRIYPDFALRHVLRDGYLASLTGMDQSRADGRCLAVASYISYPRSTEVANALRMVVCPMEQINCDRCALTSAGDRPCNMIDGILDRDIFAPLLAPGDRSALFKSLSSVVRNHYDGKDVFYFYMNVDSEIARIEIPWWVASEPGLVDLVQAVTFSQCRRGLGYPVVLSEAHERAVITGADREQFWCLVENYYNEARLHLPRSEKSLSKRSRYV